MLVLLATLSFVLGIIWLAITIHVLHYSELKQGRFDGWFGIWPFYAEMKKNYPTSSMWARFLTYAMFLLATLWFIGELI